MTINEFAAKIRAAVAHQDQDSLINSNMLDSRASGHTAGLKATWSDHPHLASLVHTLQPARDAMHQHGLIYPIKNMNHSANSGSMVPVSCNLGSPPSLCDRVSSAADVETETVMPAWSRSALLEGAGSRHNTMSGGPTESSLNLKHLPILF